MATDAEKIEENKALPKSQLRRSVIRSQERQYKILEERNAEYARPEDEYSNFRSRTLPHISVEERILLRLEEKLDRLANSLRGGTSRNRDSIMNSIDDINNYANIILAHIEFEESMEKANFKRVDKQEEKSNESSS